MKLFSIYDVKSETYTSPISMNTRNEAIRSFQNEVNRTDIPNHPYSSYPSDFVLVELADYNQFTGVISPLETVSHVAYGADLVNKSE